jgi:hypothetical protein
MIGIAPRRGHSRALALVLACTVTVSVVACGSGSSSPTEPQATPGPTPSPAPTPTTGQAVEFQGRVTATSTAGRRLELADGTTLILRADTVFDPTGDLFDARQIASAAAAGARVRVEGDGVRRSDGGVRALAIKAEVDD